jgi:CRP-like cAMP-binding protein
MPDNMTDEAHWWEVLREGDLSGYLTDSEHKELLAATEKCRAGAGDFVFKKGSPSKSVLLVEEGELEVLDESLGELVSLARVGPGGIVGEVGLLDGQVRTHHVRALSACRLRRLTRQGLLGLAQINPTLFAKVTIAMAQVVARRFRSAVQELEPIRSFAASLRDPVDASLDTPGFDELEEAGPDEAARAIREAKSRGDGSSVGL